MSRKRYTPEQILGKLREAEVGLAQGQTAAQVCRTLGIAEQTFYRWRREYGGLKVEQARRLKALEQENTRLRRAVSDLALDKLILQEGGKGKLLSPTRRPAMHPAYPEGPTGVETPCLRGDWATAGDPALRGYRA